MKPWTNVEQQALVILAPLGGPACALAFCRSQASIRHKASQLHVSLRRRTFGTQMGQCGPATLKRVRELREASLCPDCGYNYAAVPSTGLCPYCHVKRLRQVHEENIAAIEAQRELWTARSRLQRRRRALAEAQRLSETETGDGSATMDLQDASDPGRSACTP